MSLHLICFRCHQRYESQELTRECENCAGDPMPFEVSGA